MAQRVNQIGGDAKRAAQADNVDILRLVQQLHRFVELVGIDLHRQLLQCLTIDHRKDIQNLRRAFRRGGGVVGGGLAEQTRSLGIVDRLFHQVLTKNLFHFVEAAKAERVGEANQRRRRHVSLRGNRGHGIKGDAVAVIENITSHLLQALAQRFVAATNIIL